MKASIQEKSAAARNTEVKRGGKSMPAVPVQKVSEKEDPVSDEYPKTANENRTGLPDNLKSGIETLSRFSMDDVRVHYNSAKPAQLQALAYAQGSDIHVAAGQERHLPHEAWHVVQQKQGRVKPTMQMKADVLINDDAGLENEADLMGSKASLIGSNSSLDPNRSTAHNMSLKGGTAQLVSDSQQPIQRQLSMTEMMKIGPSATTYKFVVGPQLYGTIIAALNTAQEVHDLFKRIKEDHPVLFSDAAAQTSGIPLGAKLAKKLPAAKAALPALVTSLLPGTAASSAQIPVASSSNSSSSTSSSSSSAAPGPVTPTMIISTPKPASALTFGEPSASSSALSAESTNPSVATAEIRSGGITDHGTYSGAKGKLTKGTIAAYVVSNHQSAEREKAPGGGDQFVLKLGYVGLVQWFITYHLGSGPSASKAIITHFGPFGEGTSSKYE